MGLGARRPFIEGATHLSFARDARDRCHLHRLGTRRALWLAPDLAKQGGLGRASQDRQERRLHPAAPLWTTESQVSGPDDGTAVATWNDDLDVHKRPAHECLPMTQVRRSRIISSGTGNGESYPSRVAKHPCFRPLHASATTAARTG